MLTDRQRAIVAMLIADCPRKQIAYRLCISLPTVQHDVDQVKRLMGVRSMAALAAKYIELYNVQPAQMADNISEVNLCKLS